MQCACAILFPPRGNCAEFGRLGPLVLMIWRTRLPGENKNGLEAKLEADL
jgi:hypothetical protein